MKALLVAAACTSQLAFVEIGWARATSPNDAPPAAPEPASEAVPPKLDLGPDLGFALKDTSKNAKYDAALAFGGHARLHLKPWLVVRLAGRTSEHTLNVEERDREFELRARFNEVALGVEPVWVVVPRWSVSLGPYASWQYLKSPEARILESYVAERRGSQTEFGLNLGANYEALKNWLLFQATLKSGIVASYGGDFFRETQVITFSGFMDRLPGLPKVRSSHELSLSLSFLL